MQRVERLYRFETEKQRLPSSDTANFKTGRKI
jgi:hypothetical protein